LVDELEGHVSSSHLGSFGKKKKTFT